MRFHSEKVADAAGRRSVRFYLEPEGGGELELAAWGEERETRDGHYSYRRAEGFGGGPPLHCGNLAGVHAWLAGILGLDPKVAIRESWQIRPPAGAAGGGAGGARGGAAGPAGAAVGASGVVARVDSGLILAGQAGRGVKRGRAQEELVRIARDLHECGSAAATAQTSAIQRAAGLAREAALRWVGVEARGAEDAAGRGGGAGGAKEAAPRGPPRPWEGLSAGQGGGDDPKDGLVRALKLAHEVRELRASPPQTLSAFGAALGDLEQRCEGLKGEAGASVRESLEVLRDRHFGLVTRLTAAALAKADAPVPLPPVAEAWDSQPRRSSSSLAAALWYRQKEV